MEFPLTLEPAASGKEPVFRRQSAAPAGDEAGQHSATTVVITLRREIVHELRHGGALIERVELEIHVVYRVAVGFPQRKIVALDIIVRVRRDGREGNHVVLLHDRDQTPYALRERLRVGFEVFVVDVDPVEVVALDYVAHRHFHVGVLGFDGGDVGRGEIFGVPENVELPIRGRRGRRDSSSQVRPTQVLSKPKPRTLLALRTPFVVFEDCVLSVESRAELNPKKRVRTKTTPQSQNGRAFSTKNNQGHENGGADNEQLMDGGFGAGIVEVIAVHTQPENEDEYDASVQIPFVVACEEVNVPRNKENVSKLPIIKRTTTIPKPRTSVMKKC
nr:uncharacterized protein LOC109157166 [Ipomoea batatas]